LAALDNLSLYVGLGTILGARLGHCLFYEPDYYLIHPEEMLYIWKGGLASHGAVIGILLSTYLFGRRYPQTDFWFVTDRLVVVIALAGSLIRLGNLANSEIYGKPTTVPWAFVFERLADGLPRHPTQLYESFYYMICFLLLYLIYLKTRMAQHKGLLLGLFMVLIFGFRFFIEFWKENQVEMENKLEYNLGQMLSVPVVITGFILMFKNTGKAIH
jgi:prolipoprotein diacylglyceryl transferase